MDLRMKFGLGRVEKTVNTRVIIVEIAKHDATAVVGALADSVKEVLELEPEPSILRPAWARPCIRITCAASASTATSSS
jgi:chemotaxis signal transduction protein